MNSNYFDNKIGIDVLNKWKVHIVVITLIGAVLGSALSLMYSPRYSSFAIIYPVNLAPYSEESNSEQMVQILSSKYIKDKVIKSFNLVEHYNISVNNEDYLNELYSIYDNNISISKTEYESIKIFVVDENSKIAAHIVDSIIKFYNYKVASLYRVKIKEVVNVAHAEIVRWGSIRDSVDIEMSKIREKHGINDYKIQLKEVSVGIYKTNNKNLLVEGKEFLNVLSEYGPQFELLSIAYYQATKEVNGATIAYYKSLKEHNKVITYAQIVTEPFVSYKKDYSKRYLIIFFSTLSSFIFSLLLILFLSKNNDR